MICFRYVPFTSLKTRFGLSAVLGVLLLAVGLEPAGAEVGLRADMRLLNFLYRGQGDTYFGASGLVDLRYDSLNNDMVKAGIGFELNPAQEGTDYSLNLRRAWVKANFPALRLTLGKTKVAWGNGVFFNAGDIIFGSLAPVADFTEEVLRNDTSWLTALNVPLSDFSFLEFVYLPPTTNALNDRKAKDLTFGMRAFGAFNNWKIEGGILQKGATITNNDFLGTRIYGSFHGHAGVDWYGSLSITMGKDDYAGVDRNDLESIQKTLALSLGIFHLIDTGADGLLSLRLETSFMPFQITDKKDYLTLRNQKELYVLYFYPEVLWTDGRGITWGLRSVISPIDLSLRLAPSFHWNVFQGFSLLGYLNVDLGNADSTFSTDRKTLYSPNDHEYNGSSLFLGAEYKF